MFTVIARIRVLPGKEAEFEEIFARRRERCLGCEPEMLRYDLFREPADPGVYTVIEEFTSAAGHEEHLRLSTDHLPLMACFDGRPETHALEPLSGNIARRAD